MISVGASNWRRNGSHVQRTYYFSELSGNQSKTLRIDCLFESRDSTCSSAIFRLHPFHLLHKQVFSSFIGTQDRQIGYTIDLLATSPEHGITEFRANSPDDVASCVSALRAGKNTLLLICDGQTEIANLAFPNDAAFANLCDSMRQEISRSLRTHEENNTSPPHVASSGWRVKALKIDAIAKSTPWIAGIIVLLYFTPLGGIVKVLVGGGALIGAVILVFNALFDSGGLREAGIKFAWALGLVALAIIVSIALPSPPFSSSSYDTCWDGRNNHC